MTKNVAELFFPSNIIYFGAEIKTWEKVKFTDPFQIWYVKQWNLENNVRDQFGTMRMRRNPKTQKIFARQRVRRGI